MSQASFAKTNKYRSACHHAHKQVPKIIKGVRDVAWVTPSQTKKINGLAFGIAAVPAKNSKQQINGLNIEANPLVFFMPFAAIYMVPTREMKETQNRSGIKKEVRITKDSEIQEVVSGLDITTFAMVKTESKGMSINVMGTFTYQKGVNISAVVNGNNHFKGIQVASLCNVNVYGKGLSIAAVNVCYNCSGLQIGLINKNGNKTTPFFSYLSKKKAQQIAANQKIAEAFFNN